MHILYVCTGNICRSPTAERLTRAYAEACLPDPSQLTTASAGTQAVVGSSMHPTAEMVLLGLGGQGSGFRAGLLEEWQVAEADLVLTMSRKQRRTVLGGSPGRCPARSRCARRTRSCRASPTRRCPTPRT